MQPPTISDLTNIYFETGAAGLLADVLAQHAIARPLIVTDEGLVSLGILDRLPITGAAVFSQVQTNPTEANVLAGLKAYREGQCDGLVAVGGIAGLFVPKDGVHTLRDLSPPGLGSQL